MTAQQLTIENPGINLKRTMIYERIAESGSIGSYGQSKKPFINEGNRKKRVLWARQHLHWLIEQ